MAAAFQSSTSTAFLGAGAQLHLPDVHLPGAHLREVNGPASVPGAYAATGVTLATLVASMVIGASASLQKIGSRRAPKVGRRFFASQTFASESEKAAQAQKAAEEEQERKYQEFLDQRDALNLPNAIPFLGLPAYRSFMFNVPGDAGFDPLSICKDPQDFEYQRRAELTHGRFAMLAAAGWPLSELYQPLLAQDLGLENKLASDGRAPSVLNGGLNLFDDNGPTSLAILLAAAFFMALKIEDKVGKETFDPLSLKDFSPPVLSGMLPKGREWMAEAELKNSRVAMLAVTAYAAAEFYTKVPVVKETPILFSAPF